MTSLMISQRWRLRRRRQNDVAGSLRREARGNQRRMQTISSRPKRKEEVAHLVASRGSRNFPSARHNMKRKTKKS